MKAIIGANGFLARAIQRVTKPGSLTVLGSDTCNLMGNATLPTLKDKADCLVYCGDYYPGLQATHLNGQSVWRTNVEMYQRLFQFAKMNQIPRVVTIGTTACYPITDEPLRESMFNGDPKLLNPKMVGYALSRFTLLDIAALARVSWGIRHYHFVVPNFYGPGDKYEPGRSHLLASWIRDFWDAKQRGDEQIQLWGSPDTKREFMYIDDVARWVLTLADQEIPREVLNVGYGLAPTYSELARAVLFAIDSRASVTWDQSRPNVRKQEVLDLTALQPYRELLPTPTRFNQGVRATVSHYLEHVLQ